MSIGPSRPLVLEKPAKIDIPQAARYFGARGEPDTATRTLLEKCAVPILAAATPRAVWLKADVDSLLEAGILQGGDVMKHLEGCPQDALGSALAEQAADAAEAELRQWAAREEKYLTGRFSPGYGDWPITVQPKVAAVLDTARRAGICVLNTNLMTPRKSVTAILGLSDHPVKGHLAGCGHCVLRARCEYRKRGKTCASE